MNQDAPEWKLITELATASLKEQKRARRWNILFRGLIFTYLFVLLFMFTVNSPQSKSGLSSIGPHTAVIKINGIIMADEPAGAQAVNSALNDAFKDKNTKAVLLAINSPGGSPVQAGYIYDEIKRLRGKHPQVKVYASISDIGASGAYYIAAAADEIYADKASLVGSIGVISASFGYVGIMQKLGIERRVYTSGKSKAFLDPYSPVNEKNIEHWQTVLKTTHGQFIDQVKAGRGKRLQDDPEIFSGLMWTGEQALEKGLVDGLASPSQVARDIIGESNMVDFTVPLHPLDKVLKQLGVSVEAAVRSVLLQQASLRY